MSSSIVGDLEDYELPLTSVVIETPELARFLMNALEIQGSQSFETNPAMPGENAAATEETWHATLGLPVVTSKQDVLKKAPKLRRSLQNLIVLMAIRRHTQV